MKTWFITGASRGLGCEMARAALEAGHRVAATGRHAEDVVAALKGYGERLQALTLDVTSQQSIDDAVRGGIEKFGRIDVLVNNAGYGQLGAFEELSAASIERQFATNVFGVFNVTRAFLPIFRAQRAGHILNISSTAGVTGFDGASIYCATKFAVSGWSESLSVELARFGIKVTCVHPGPFRTDFLDSTSVRYGDVAIDDYRQSREEKRKALDAANHRQAGDPVKFGRAVVELVASEKPPARWAAGSDAFETSLKRAETLRTGTLEWGELSLSTDVDQH